MGIGIFGGGGTRGALSIRTLEVDVVSLGHHGRGSRFAVILVSVDAIPVEAGVAATRTDRVCALVVALLVVRDRGPGGGRVGGRRDGVARAMAERRAARTRSASGGVERENDAP